MKRAKNLTMGILVIIAMLLAIGCGSARKDTIANPNSAPAISGENIEPDYQAVNIEQETTNFAVKNEDNRQFSEDIIGRYDHYVKQNPDGTYRLEIPESANINSANRAEELRVEEIIKKTNEWILTTSNSAKKYKIRENEGWIPYKGLYYRWRWYGLEVYYPHEIVQKLAATIGVSGGTLTLGSLGFALYKWTGETLMIEQIASSAIPLYTSAEIAVAHFGTIAGLVVASVAITGVVFAIGLISSDSGNGVIQHIVPCPPLITWLTSPDSNIAHAQEPTNTPQPSINNGSQSGNGQSDNLAPTPESTPTIDNSVFLGWPGNPDSSVAPEYNDSHKNPNDEFWVDIWAKNEGNTTWEGDKYYLQNNFAEKGFGNLPDHIYLDYTIKPGEVWHKRFTFTSPNESGQYRLTCRIGKDPQTEFGNYINWDIIVTANNNSVFLGWPYTPESSEAPEFNNRVKLPGEEFWIDYGVKNTSNNIWKSGSYYLWNNFKGRGFGDFPDHIYLDHDVKPGEVWITRFNFHAPITPSTSRLTCRMGKDPYTEFGNYINWDIIVNTPIPIPTPTSTPSPSPTPTIATYTFTLTVINYFGREPMPGVVVVFDSKEYLTDEQGKFQLDVLKGQYNLEVKKEGFITQTTSVDITGPLKQTIVLKPTTLPSPYFFTSTKTGENYYLHFDEVTLNDGTTKKIYYFSKEAGGENACDLPEGYTVEENPRTGLPMLRRI
ncbi:MAG: hypothetical protein M1338_03535 [Patescibacteria group bacterium]|nr:hypothetical protein [Patescibacteria group bacterium]